MDEENIVVQKRKKHKRRAFDEWLADARQYRETYGDLLVPNDYVTQGGHRLGRWIERKRAQYNGTASVNGRLYPDEIVALNSIGMSWKLEYRFEWKEWIREAALFYDTYGHLEVPQGYAHGEYALGNWIAEQRQRYASGKLSKEQIGDLEKLGIRWECHETRSWEEWYGIAEAYYRKHGDLRVPADYVTPSGERLGRWIGSQRDCYNCRRGKRRLSAAEIRRLEEIGMCWSIAQEKDVYWYQMLFYARDYALRYNRMPPRTGDKVITSDGHDLTNWVRAQQDRCRKGLLSMERAAALEAAGIVGRRVWKQRSQQAVGITYDSEK